MVGRLPVIAYYLDWRELLKLGRACWRKIPGSSNPSWTRSYTFCFFFNYCCKVAVKRGLGGKESLVSIIIKTRVWEGTSVKVTPPLRFQFKTAPSSSLGTAFYHLCWWLPALTTEGSFCGDRNQLKEEKQKGKFTNAPSVFPSLTYPGYVGGNQKSPTCYRIHQPRK